MDEIFITIEKIFLRDPNDDDVLFSRKQVGSALLEQKGLVGSCDWHRKPKTEIKNLWENRDGSNERGLLGQFKSDYEKLKKRFPEFKNGFVSPNLAENLLLDGNVDSETICVGDIFICKENGAKIMVTSPRRPCSNIDKIHGQKYGKKGVRAYSVANGQVGTFFKVLNCANIKQGNKFILYKRPYPKWTIFKVSSTVYGDPNLKSNYKLTLFNGTNSDLQDLLSIKDFAEMEWKSDLRKIWDNKKNICTIDTL